MLLGLFGGSSADLRSSIHVLIVGDPGLGKSQLLSFAASIAPRSIYLGAQTSTAVGLTAAIVENGSLEAGALVLADQGVCCIDEFDKLPEEARRSLLDVMEQQTVSIAKAGVICSLSARTSVFAAANPVGGHFKYTLESHIC